MRVKGENLKAQTMRGMEICNKLVKNNWKLYEFIPEAYHFGPGGSVSYKKDISKAEAEKEMGELGILEEVCIKEVEEKEKEIKDGGKEKEDGKRHK